MSRIFTIVHDSEWTGCEAVLKTTVELPDELVRSAKAHAVAQKITFRALVERGLRLAMQADQTNAKFVLRDASVRGGGLNPELKAED